MTDNLDTEENLFKSIENENYEDEDENDDLAFNEDTLSQNFIDDDEDDDDDDEEEEELFEEEEEEFEENDDEDFSEQELEDFNKKLGTDFKSVEDLKASFNKKESDTDEAKEAAEYQILTNKVSLYDRYIGMDNENLVRNQLLSLATSQKKDINDPDVLADIEERLQGLKDLETMDSMAETLRSNLQTQKDKAQGSIDSIDNKKIEISNASARKNVDDLQNALSTIFDEKEFMGITVTKEDITQVYEDIRSDKFFQGINNNQEMIAKLAMFIKYEKEISKLVKAPTHSDKTKTAFDFFTNNGKEKQRSITSAKGSASSGSVEENTMNFIK